MTRFHGRPARGACLFAMVAMSLPPSARAYKFSRKLDEMLRENLVKHGRKVGFVGIVFGTALVVHGVWTGDQGTVAIGAGAAGGGVATIIASKGAADPSDIESGRQAKEFRDRLKRNRVGSKWAHASRSNRAWDTMKWRAKHLIRRNKRWGR